MKKIAVSLCLILAGLLVSAQTPCGFKYGKTPEDSLKCLEQISQFRVFYDQKNYADAYPSWQYIVEHCPCSWDGVFTYAQTMFDNLIKVEKDSAKKEMLIDELINSYQIRYKYFPKKFSEGNGLGFMSFNEYRYRIKDYLSNKKYDKIEAMYNRYVKSIELDKENTQPALWDTYFTVAEIMTQMKKDTTIIIDAYERATDYIDAAVINCYKKYEKQLPNFENLEAAFANNQIDKMEYDKRFKQLSADTARQMKLVSNYTKTLRNIENKFAPYAPCSVLEKVYAKKLDANKDNIAVLKKIVATMSKNNCIMSPVFSEALEIVHKQEPGAQSAYLMGNFSIMHNKDYDKAIEYYKEAINLYETNEQKVDPYYMLGLAYMAKGNYVESRAAALAAIKIKPNCGKAYILIGDLYASSGSRCSGGDEVPGAYAWAAADKYARAASVDPSVAEDAAAKRAKLPGVSGEEKFKRGLKSGDSYHVGCWIQENTTVR